MTRMREEPDPPIAEMGEEARIKRRYRRYAASRGKRRAWSADNPGNVAIRSELLDRLFEKALGELAGQGEILDAGCGTGWWLAQLAAGGVTPGRMHGIDLLPDRVEAAARLVPGTHIAQADARRLPFEDERFGLVLLLTVLSSMDSGASVAGALREVRRVLAPGGLLLVYEPRVPNPLNPATRRIGRADLEQVLERRCLSVESLTVLPPLARRLGPLTGRLYPPLARFPPLRTHFLAAYRRPGG
jgi:SAM-dependent methyltransferase